MPNPKFSIAPDGRLVLVPGGSVYEGKSLKERQPRVSFSPDGRAWTTPRRVPAHARITRTEGSQAGDILVEHPPFGLCSGRRPHGFEESNSLTRPGDGERSFSSPGRS